MQRLGGAALVAMFIVGASAESVSAEALGHWRLDEGDGPTFADSAIGNHEGVLLGAQWISDGISGAALRFRGDGFGDSARMPGGYNFSGTNAATLEAWFRLNEPHQDFEGILSSDGCCLYRLMVSPDLHPYYNAGVHQDVEVPEHTFEIGRWYHMAMTISAASDSNVLSLAMRP